MEDLFVKGVYLYKYTIYNHKLTDDYLKKHETFKYQNKKFLHSISDVPF